LDLSKHQTDKKITDEEILKLLEQPLARPTGAKNKNKKKKKPSLKKNTDEAEGGSSDAD
jgi:topoisomerase IA-like protein